MDEVIADVLVSGAQTIVRLMVNDLWNGLRGSVARIFGDRHHDRVVDDLEASRARLISADTSSLERAERQEQDRWEATLRLRVLDEPDALELVRALIHDAHSAGLAVNTNSGAVKLTAYARDNARVYQQGYGSQHNS